MVCSEILKTSLKVLNPFYTLIIKLFTKLKLPTALLGILLLILKFILLGTSPPCCALLTHLLP